MAANRVPGRVDVHEVTGVPGHIGKARAAGYAMGSAPYVTCVDDDDYLLAMAFETMVRELEKRDAPAALFPGEHVLEGERLKLGWPRHHLAVYRRDVLIDHRQWACMGDVVQARSLGDNGVDLDKRLYVHTVYPESRARALRRMHEDECRRAYATMPACSKTHPEFEKS
jgi:hypothetical protein